MKKFAEPTIEILRLDAADILTSSTDEGDWIEYEEE